MNAYLKTCLIKCLFSQKAIRLQINLKKSIRDITVVSKSFIGSCWRNA